MNKAIFIDKDGTLIPDIPYNVTTSLITLQEGAVEGLSRLSADGFLLIIITNQAGVAQGYFEEEDVILVRERLREMFAEQSLKLHGFYYCPHHPEAKLEKYRKSCACRKPAAGMIQQAIKDFNVDARNSWMIGDILHDVEAGHRAGCSSVLIDNGNETEWMMNEWRKPDLIAANMLEAADFILKSRVENII